ncbi:MAG: DUF488 family protein [Bradyrhizobiaceae bacterium]|nr:DUF488 family protein [Bradyrhizobiaceae bacterium]
MKSKHAVRTKRVYEPPAQDDGKRVLVDRIWPRGLTKQRAAVDVWLKEIAPSAALRTWFGHDPERWEEFRERYFEELRANSGEVARLLDLRSAGKVTLLFGAHDPERNNAAALQAYLASLGRR